MNLTPYMHINIFIHLPIAAPHVACKFARAYDSRFNTALSRHSTPRVRMAFKMGCRFLSTYFGAHGDCVNVLACFSGHSYPEGKLQVLKPT